MRLKLLQMILLFTASEAFTVYKNKLKTISLRKQWTVSKYPNTSSNAYRIFYRYILSENILKTIIIHSQ